MKTQAQYFYDATRAAAEKDLTALELLFGHSPISDDELRASIKRRPALYTRYAGFLGKRPGDGGIYWGA